MAIYDEIKILGIFFLKIDDLVVSVDSLQKRGRKIPRGFLVRIRKAVGNEKSRVCFLIYRQKFTMAAIAGRYCAPYRREFSIRGRRFLGLLS